VNTKALVLRVLLFTALLGAQACSLDWLRGGASDLLPKPGANEGSPAAGRNIRATEGYALKLVHGKEDPATLIARDGTTCSVDKKKYDSAKVGKPVWCTWIERRR
jgi:hypothetical protein